jgi:hypothetical protein
MSLQTDKPVIVEAVKNLIAALSIPASILD